MVLGIHIVVLVWCSVVWTGTIGFQLVFFYGDQSKSSNVRKSINKLLT